MYDKGETTNTPLINVLHLEGLWSKTIDLAQRFISFSTIQEKYIESLVGFLSVHMKIRLSSYFRPHRRKTVVFGISQVMIHFPNPTFSPGGLSNFWIRKHPAGYLNDKRSKCTAELYTSCRNRKHSCQNGRILSRSRLPRPAPASSA